jgi:virginiamycin B lyase
MASVDGIGSQGAKAPGLAHRSLAHLLFGSLISLLAVLLLAPAAFAITEFPVPTPASQPAGITVGPDGALWFTEEAPSANKIGRITTAGSFSEFPVTTPAPSTSTGPAEITMGPDGRLWFTEFGASKIGAITTGGVISEWSLPSGSEPDGITAGPDGRLWFTEPGSNKIGAITTAGSITEYSLPTGGNPGDITVGPDGRLWFTESDPANKIGAITTAGSVSEYGLPSGSDPSGITASGGALWFTEHLANKIGRISTTGAITEYGPTGSGPSGITTGSDGALWFTETIANQIGRISTTGAIIEFPVPTPASEPGAIAAGPDGALWFNEFAANQIGRIEPATSSVTPPPPPPPPSPPPPPPAAPQSVASVLSLRVSPRRFRAASRGPSISAKVGTRVTYRLSASAATRFTIERERVGRRRGRRCVRPTPRNRRARRCKRYTRLRGSLSHTGKAGTNRFRFSGRLRRKRLRPGRYRLVAVATLGTTKSSAKSARFRIVRR